MLLAQGGANKDHGGRVPESWRVWGRTRPDKLKMVYEAMNYIDPATPFSVLIPSNLHLGSMIFVQVRFET